MDHIGVAGLRIEIVQGLEDIAVHIVLQLGAAQGLERVWRDSGGDAGFQHDAVFGAAAARDRVLDDFDIGILVVKGREHRAGGFTFAGSRPPVEDFQLLCFRHCSRFDDHGLDNFCDLYFRLTWTSTTCVTTTVCTAE